MERQHRKASSASDEPTILEQARRELAAMRVMCHEDRSQGPSVPSEDDNGGEPLAVEGVDADIDGNDDEDENSNDFLPRSPPPISAA